MGQTKTEYNKAYYKTHKDEQIAAALDRQSKNPKRSQAATIRWEDRQMAWLNDLKAQTPCADCNEHFPPDQMDYDHLPGFEKVMRIGLLVRQRTKQAVEEEIAKCELVCKSCHTKRGHKRGQLDPRGWKKRN